MLKNYTFITRTKYKRILKQYNLIISLTAITTIYNLSTCKEYSRLS